MCAAFGTAPFTNVERQAFNDVSTIRTQFAGREEAVNQLFSLSVPFAFVVNHLPKSPHADIENCAGEAMVRGHAMHIQILNADHVEPSYEVSGKLVESVGPAVSDVLMQASNFHALSLPSSTTFFAPGKNALQSGQLGEITPKVARVGNAFTVRQSGETTHPQVNTHRLSGLRQLLDCFVKAERYVVPPRRFLDYRNRRGGTQELSTPTNIETAKAGKNKVFIYSIQLKSVDSVFRGLFVFFLFERGVTPTLGPEIEEGSLKMAQRLLGRDAGNLSQPFSRILFLQSGQQRGGVKIADSFLFCSPCFRSQVKCPIVYVTTATEDAGKLLCLGVSWIETKSASCFHTNIIYCVSKKVNTYFQKGAAIHPQRLKLCDFLAV
jgi:hypothetical protein